MSASQELQYLINVITQNEPEQSGELDWEKVLYFAKLHSVLDLLSFRAPQNLSASIKSRLAIQSREALFTNMVLVGEYLQLFTAAKAQSIVVYPYKGKVWSQWLYNNIHVRSAGDIDVLVDQSEVFKVIQIASELGYVLDPYKGYLLDSASTRKAFLETDYHIPLFKYDESGEIKFVIEIHWMIAYPRLCFHLNEFKKYEAGSITLQGVEVPFFSNEYNLLLLIVHHGGKEEWARLKYIADLEAYLVRYASTTNWKLVQQIAKDKGIYNLLKWSLSIVVLLGSRSVEFIPNHLIVGFDLSSLMKTWTRLKPVPENATLSYLLHGLRTRDTPTKWELVKAHLHFASYFSLHTAKIKWLKSQS